MGNHFHILLRIKEKSEIGFLNPDYANSDNLELKWRTVSSVTTKNLTFKKPVPEKMLQHFFLTYSKRFNKKYNRTGSLFEHPFKRIKIDTEKYLKQLIIYIHNNPVKHKICKNPLRYPWTSYQSIFSTKPTKVARNFVSELFDGKNNYQSLHIKDNDFEDIKLLTFDDDV